MVLISVSWFILRRGSGSESIQYVCTYICTVVASTISGWGKSSFALLKWVRYILPSVSQAKRMSYAECEYRSFDLFECLNSSLQKGRSQYEWWSLRPQLTLYHKLPCQPLPLSWRLCTVWCGIRGLNLQVSRASEANFTCKEGGKVFRHPPKLCESRVFKALHHLNKIWQCGCQVTSSDVLLKFLRSWCIFWMYLGWFIGGGRFQTDWRQM